jgi:aminopeptidase YwaD
MILRKRGLKVAASLLAMSVAFGSVGFANDVTTTGKSDYSQDQKVVSRVDAERAIGHVRYLSEEIGPRPGGLQAEKESAEYIANVLKGYGYKVEFQYFPVADQYIADVAFADGTSWQMAAAPNGKVSKEAVTGEVLFVDGGTNLADFPADTAGKIVVMPRASTTAAYRSQVDNAVKSGASGVILQSLVGSRGNYGQTFNPSLTTPVDIPVYGAAFIQGERGERTSSKRPC